MINSIGYVDVKPTATFAAPPLHARALLSRPADGGRLPAQAQTDIAEVYLREVGTGRVAYFPGDIDRTFWEILDPDHGRIIANVVRWALERARRRERQRPGRVGCFRVGATTTR